LIEVTYMDIHKEGLIVLETDMFRHYHDARMLIRYDSNLIAYKRMPNLKEFSHTEKYLEEYHFDRGQKHVKFIFPPNEEIDEKLLANLTGKEYDIGFTEMYKINPRNFPEEEKRKEIEIVHIGKAQLEDFLTLSYQQDLIFGKEFATLTRDNNRRHFHNSTIWQVMAYYNGVPAGGLKAIIKEQTVEIDGLFVLPEFQRNRIAAHLQQFVMKSWPEKTVILLADGEDTPREMYKKQNYDYVGFQYEAVKVFEDE